MARVDVEASLTDEQRARASLCATAVGGVLDQYGCIVAALPFIGPDGRVGAEVHVLPKTEGPPTQPAA